MFIFNTSQRVSTAIIKSNAIQVIILSVLSLYLQSVWPVLFLTLDYGLRAFNFGKISPLAIISKKILIPLFKFGSILVTQAPKSFAARIGLTLSVMSLIFYQLNNFIGFIIPITLLAIFSFLEAFFGFCAGCKIYGLLIRWKVFGEDDCRDCKLD